MNRSLHTRLILLLFGLLIVSAACDRQDNHWDAFDPSLKTMTVQADTLSLAEGGEALVFKVALLMVPDDTVRVVIASPDSQVVAEPDTLIFVPVDDDWSLPREVALVAIDDMVDEGPHLAAASVTAFSTDSDYDGQGGLGMVPVAIADNDRAGVHVTESVLTVVESLGGAAGETYRVRLLSRPTAEVTVTAIETSAEPSFHLDPTVLVFTPDNWQVEQEIRLWADLDDIDANNMNLVVTHTSESADPHYDASLVSPSLDVMLLDDTLPPLASLELVVPGDNTIFEAGGTSSLDVVVSLNHGSILPTVVHLATRNGTATGGADFQIINQDVTFAPGGALQQVFAVTALDDGLIEEVEAFQVVISGVEGVIVGEQSYLDVTLVDEDRANLTLTARDLDEDNGGAAFVVSMPVAAQFPVSFTLTTTDGTASAASDYDAIGAIFALAPGQTQRVVPVAVRPDGAHEDDENLTAVLSNLSINAVWDGAQALLTIRDDDPQTIVFTGSEIGETQPSGLFHLELAAYYNEPLVLLINTMSGDGFGAISGQEDALGGPDYDTVSNLFWLIPAGTTSVTYTVPLVADATAEASREYFRLAIQSASHPGFAGLVATCTILDDDQPEIIISDVAVLESDANATFNVTMHNRFGIPTTSRADVRFDYATVSQTAASDLDYAATSGTLTIPAGAASGVIVVPILEDGLDDDNETFILEVSSPNNATFRAIGTPPFCTITDNELAVMNLTQTMAAENEGAVHQFAVELTVPRQEPTGFTLALLAGTSGGVGVDYTFGSTGYRVIPPYVTSLTFQVPFLDDKLIGEADETMSAEISGADLAMGVTSLPMTIIDAPLVEIQPATALEGTNLEFNVVLTVPSTVAITFAVQFSSGSADILADINSSNTGPFTIPAGDWSTMVSVPTVPGDGVEASVETFTLSLFGPSGAVLGAVNSAVGSIQDGD